MGRRFLLTALSCLLLLTNGLNAESSCKKGCTESDNGILQYVPGNVYEYNFDSILTIGVSSGPNADDTTLKVTGLAKLFAEGNCGYTLQLGGVKVVATKARVEKKLTSTILKPVHFTMTGGKVEPELCTDANDNEYSLNVKRAIVSMLQTTKNDEQEVDVFGLCPTHTSTSTVGNAEVITKIRNLNNCAYRESITNGLLAGVVNENAGVRSSMALHADFTKESKVVGGIVESVNVIEEYKYNSSPKGGSDLRAKVVSNLKVKNPSGTKANAPVTGSSKSGIIFEKPDVPAAKNIGALKAAITQLIQLSGDYVQADTASAFVDLIRLMRNADAETLLELAAVPHPNKVLGRKIYIDALVRTGTAESAKAIMKQLNKMDDKEKFISILSLRTVQDVDKDVLLQATTLLTPNAAKEIYLAIGNLVSKYCQRKNCEDSDIEPISKKFVESLKHCKPNTKKDEERIVYILKGIVNTHHLAKNVASNLAECAAGGRSNRVRVAALQAFSAASCQPALKKKALELLRNRNEDSELRIEAYLAVIDCPTAETANEISEIVNSETVNQVGSFIKSNLQAIRDSTDSSKANQRHFLGNVRVTKTFPKDFRRFSFNNELSYKLDALGLSASSDYKLIYSQHGFLPRSARLNVSTEIYGTNFNIFEAGIRQENFEKVLEYYVGPKGLINKDIEDTIRIIEGRDARVRRSIADDANKISKKYKTYASKNVDDLNLDLSLKVFGSEIMFLSLGDNIPSSLEEIIKEFSTIAESSKQQLSSFSKEFRCHSFLLDADVTYPTAIGIPFELSAQVFAATKLDFAINVDVDALLQQNWQNANFHLKVIPSVDVNANIKAGFDGLVLSTGIRSQTNLQSATGSDVKAAIINDGNGFNVDVELPREKIELVNVQMSADFYIAEQDKAVKSIELKEKKKQPKQEACFNQLEIIGFSVCVENGIGVDERTTIEQLLLVPQGLNVYVMSERNFNIKGTYAPTGANGVQTWKLAYDTPGSKSPHATALTFDLGVNPRTFGRVSFDNPQFQIALEAGVSNDNKEMVLYGQLEQNGDIKRSKVGFSKKGNEYAPLIEVQDKQGVTNNINGYRADGKVVVQKTGDKSSKFTFDNFQLINKENERITLNGWVDVSPTSLKTELRIAPGQDAFKVNGNFKIENNEYEVSLFVNDEKTPDNVIGGSAVVQLAQEKVNVQLAGKAFTWEVDTDTDVQYVKAEGSSAIKSSTFSNDFIVKHKSVQALALKVSGSTEDQNNFDFNAALYREKKVGSLGVKFNSKQKSQNDYVLEVNGKFKQHFVDLLSKCDFNGNHFVIDNALTTSWGTSITAKGDVGQRYSLKDVFVDLAGGVQINSKDKPSTWLLKVIGTPDKTTSEFRLSRDNAELVKYTGESQHPQDKISVAKVLLTVKNLATAKADFKVAKNGKGEFTMAVDTLKTEPKHKVEVNSKFTVQAPKYDIETTVTLDTEHKIYFKTENVVDKNKLSTKNVAEIANKKVLFNANGSLKGEWKLNGEIQGAFDFTCPEGRVIDGNMKRKVTTNQKTGVAQGSVALQVNDNLPTGGKRTASLTGTLEKLNAKTKDVSLSTQLSYTDFEQKKLDAQVVLKHLPKGQNKLLEFGVTVTGDMIPQTAEVTFAIDEYNKQHAVARTLVKYGNDISLKLNGNYNLGERGTPATYTIDGNLQAPQTNFKSVELHSNGKFLRSATKGQDPIVVEVHFDEKFGTGDFIRFNTVYKGSQNVGSFNGDLETKQMGAPLKLGGTFTQSHTGDLREGTAAGKQKYSADFEYGSKFLKSTVDLDYTGSESAGLHFVLDSSFDAAKQVDVVVRAHQLNGEAPAIIVEAKHDDKAYSMDTKVFRGSHKKGFNLNIGVPNAQPIVFVSEVEILGDRKAKLIVHIENLMDLDFKETAEASYKSVDDFYVTAEWNSVKLHLDNYSLDVRSQGKLVNLSLKNANGVVFGGTATVALKKEQNKSIIEGQGQLQYNGKTQNSNFRLIHQTYDLATDKEYGFSYTFNGNFGAKNGVSTLKITNRDFNVKLSVCEEKKQCTNVQLQSIVEKDEQDAALMQHSLLVLFDLRELGYPYEFEFQSKTIKEAFKFQYSLDSSIISNNNMKYQLVVSALPSNAKVQIKLPGREILLESKQQYPAQGKVFGHYENSVQFYIDKVNKPNDVMSLSATCDISGVEHSILNSKAMLKLEHPAMRPLTVSGQFDANREKQTINAEAVFDIFRSPEQKITATSKLQNVQSNNGFNVTLYEAVNSKGLDLRYELNGHAALSTDSKELTTGFDVSCSSGIAANAFVSIGKDKLEVVANVLNEPIVQVLGEYNRQKNIVKVDSKVKVFGQNSIDLLATVQPSVTKITVKHGNSLTGAGELKLGKELTFSLEGYGKKIADGRVGLDAASFLNVKSNTDEAALNEYLGLLNDELSKEYAETREKLNARFQKLQTAVEKQRQLLTEAIPDYTKVKDQYESDVNAIIRELESDPSFKQLADTYRQLYTKIVKITDEYSKVLISAYEDLQKSVSSIWNNVLSVLKETVIPAWEEFSVSATKVLEGLRTEVVNLLRQGVQTFVASLEKYGPTLKTYGKAIEETLKPYNEIVQELTKFATSAFEEIYNEIVEWLSKLPTFDTIQSDIKQKLDKMKFAEKSVELVNNIFDQLQILPTTPETSDFIQKLHDYLIAKLKQEPVNDEQFLEELFNLFNKAIRSIIATIEFSLPKSASLTGAEGIGAYLTSLPSSVEALTQIPSILSFRFSLFNYFLNENWDSVFSKDFFNSWVLFKNFELKGHLIEGRHVFTFDGEHLSFPGSCKYVLAQDSVDNNFTVIAQMNNGKLKSIVLTDSDNNFVEISDTGALKLNGAPVEYPQHTNGMHAWRNYYTVWMHSEYGVTVMCSTDLKLCHVSVNGFYTSKTRGLLGNGNAEPYDDLIQIDGTIAADAATFINGYGMGKCAPVTPDQDPKTRTEICNEIFGIDSPLAIGYLLEDPKSYRDACDQAVAAAPEKDKETAACTVALAYGSALKLDNVFVVLPLRCLKCAGAAGQRDLLQEFSVKIPTNKADLMFIVDLDVSSSVLRNLVAPVITEVRDALKSRGLTDVQIAVVAYNESQRYPALLTSDNGKLNYNGNLGDVTLNGPKAFCLDCATQYLNDKRLLDVYEIVEKLVKTVVPQSDEHAYSMALKYPFRAAAAKSIIVVRSNSLDYDNLLKVVRAQVAGAISQFDSALLHIIAPVKDLALEGVPAEKLIGFNSRLVATVDGKDNKKRPKLQFANNMGIDFVLNNGGWVFATQNFDSLKAQDQKKALNQVTNSIADSLFKTEIQADCTCLPIHGLHAQHKCSIKSSSFVPNKKIKSA